MLTPDRVLRRLRSLFTMRRKDDELDDELRFHLEMETENRIQAGMSPEDARAAALRDFGGVPRYRDETRDSRGTRAIEEFLGDLRVAARTLTRQRTHAIASVLTLAIGIGATTALAAAVYQVLLAPLPMRDPDGIATIWQQDTRAGTPSDEVSPANYLDWQARNQSFQMMAAVQPFSIDWIAPEGPARFENSLVTADFFTILGVAPLLGRTFAPDEFEPGRNNVIIFAERTWRTRFGSDSTLIGRTLILDSIPTTVVGVMPDNAVAVYDEEAWSPKIFRPDERQQRSGGYFFVIGRLKPGVTLESARTDMRAVGAQLAGEFPATNRNTGVMVIPVREMLVGSVRRALLVLLGGSGLVLLIACVNVANLQLAESIRRRREIAVRTAIGAGRGRLIRQLLTESFLLSLLGALAGLVVAHFGLSAIRAFAPEQLHQLAQLRLRGGALLFALALAVLCSAAVALMPVLEAGRIRLAEAMASGGRSMTGGRQGRKANRVLVVVEVALSLVLLIGAGLLLRSLSTLLRVDQGFRPGGVLVATVQAWGYYPTQPDRAEFVRQATRRLGALPGVESAGMTSSLPLAYAIGNERARFEIEGRPAATNEEMPSVHVAAIAGDYLQVLQIPLLAGRAFGVHDIAGSPPVLIVNRAFAQRHFGALSALGKRVQFGFMGPPILREIVGVVGDVRHNGLQHEPAPAVFVPHPQAATGALQLVMRSAADPAQLERLVRAELRDMNGAMPLTGVTTMIAHLDRSLRERRFQLSLLGAFAAVALVLSAIGIYGVMNRATSERTQEIGVRMAMGARPPMMLWLVMRHAGALALLGVGIGVVAAMLLTRFLKGMLFGIAPLDLVTYSGAVLLLMVVAMLATWLPARRAASVDPVTALRSD